MQVLAAVKTEIVCRPYRRMTYRTKGIFLHTAIIPLIKQNFSIFAPRGDGRGPEDMQLGEEKCGVF